MADPEFKRGRGWYDLKGDPAESVNLAHEPVHAPTVESAARLEALAVEMVEPMQWTPPYQGPSYECAACRCIQAAQAPRSRLPWL